MHDPSRRARAAQLAAVVAALAAPARAQEVRRTYLPVCEDRVLTLVAAATRAAADAERAAAAADALDRLLDAAADPGVASTLVEVAPGRFRGVRALALDLVLRLPPPARAALRDRHERAAAGLRGRTFVDCAARYPLARAAVDALGRDLAAALEAGDVPLATRAAFLLERAQRGDAALEGVVAPARTTVAALASASRVPLSAPARGAKLVEVGAGHAYQDDAPPPEDPQEASRAFGAAGGARAVVSNGAVALVLGPDGEVVLRLPPPRASTAPPPPSVLFTCRPSSGAGLCFLPLVLERWLAPGRSDPDAPGSEQRGDAALAGRFYALVAIDPASAGVAWWDGDPGPVRPQRGAELAGTPPGWDVATRGLQAFLRGGHVLACASDARRVYVALTQKADEPGVWLYAYERASGVQPLVLVPGWTGPTHVLSAQRPDLAGGEDEPVHPEVAAALSLDGEGRVYCTTSLGVSACLDAGSGVLLWARRAQAPPAQPPPVFPRRPPPVPVVTAVPPEPARAAPTTSGTLAVLLELEVTAVAAEDGATAWARPRREAERLLTAPGVVLAYGAAEVSVLDAATGERRQAFVLADEVRGEAALLEGGVLFPAVRGAARAVVLRFDAEVGPDGRWAHLGRGGTWTVSGVDGPANLVALPGGVAVAGARRATVLRWE